MNFLACGGVDTTTVVDSAVHFMGGDLPGCYLEPKNDSRDRRGPSIITESGCCSYHDVKNYKNALFSHLFDHSLLCVFGLYRWGDPPSARSSCVQVAPWSWSEGRESAEKMAMS